MTANDGLVALAPGRRSSGFSSMPDSGGVFVPAPGSVCFFELRDGIVKPIHPQGWVRRRRSVGCLRKRNGFRDAQGASLPNDCLCRWGSAYGTAEVRAPCLGMLPFVPHG
jgi:hypothetical protein